MRAETSIAPLPRWLATTVSVLVLWAATSVPVNAQPDPPRLVVILAVDQMRADYADTYQHQWTRGLRRLVDDGAWFENAAYPYRSTLTCAGHATIATGTFPSRHGMIKNSWWDRSSGTTVTCTTDASEAPVTYGGEAQERHSPAPLLVPTIADALRRESGGHTRVVSLSLKPRSAITLAGHAGDAVAWFDAGHTWATSTAYTRTPVDEVARFVTNNPVEDDRDEVWTRTLSPDRYLHEDDGLGEQPPGGWSNRFPHAIGDTVNAGFYQRWSASPFSDQYLTKMAVALLDSFALGQGDGTDYLSIGYSALDYVGHRFGPRSHEVQDLLVRLDATLGDLLDTLDTRVGHGRYVVALSSDHGVSPIPERASSEGLNAGRTSNNTLAADLETLLTERRGPGPHIASLQGGDLYFSPGVYDDLQRHPDSLDEIAALIKRAPGMWRVYHADQLPQSSSDDPVSRAVKLSFVEDRSGDLIIVPKPFWIGRGYAATHGSPYEYDTRIPVVLYGNGIAPGRYPAPTTPADIVPTLARLTGLTLPGLDGRVLTEALARD